MWAVQLCKAANSMMMCLDVRMYALVIVRWYLVQAIPLIFIVIFFALVAVRGVWVRSRVFVDDVVSLGVFR